MSKLMEGQHRRVSHFAWMFSFMIFFIIAKIAKIKSRKKSNFTKGNQEILSGVISKFSIVITHKKYMENSKRGRQATFLISVEQNHELKELNVPDEDDKILTAAGDVFDTAS